MASQQASASSKKHFFDLPAEMRNRIYGYAAQAAFSVPLMVVYNPAKDRANETELAILGPFYYQHNQRRKPEHYHRLALLQTCKQMYNEASGIYYTSMSVDLSFIELSSSLKKMATFTNIFKTKLQYVTHLDVEHGIDMLLLHRSARGERRMQDKHPGMFEVEYLQMKRQLFRTRALLYSLKSIAIYSPKAEGDYEQWGSESIGWDFIYALSSPESRRTMHLVFPRLQEVVTTNHFGSERFKKTGDDQWQTWYSKENLPTSSRDDWKSEMERQPGWDWDTGLSNEHALTSIGPKTLTRPGYYDD